MLRCKIQSSNTLDFTQSEVIKDGLNTYPIGVYKVGYPFKDNRHHTISVYRYWVASAFGLSDTILQKDIF
jgi:hypothetical protein